MVLNAGEGHIPQNWFSIPRHTVKIDQPMIRNGENANNNACAVRLLTFGVRAKGIRRR